MVKQATQHFCEACQLGKIHKLHFPVTEIKTKSALELIHTDLWGPSPVISREGFRYYISFVDDFTRYTWIYPLKLKSEALEVFKLYKLQVENQFQTTIKILQSDWGGEYRSFTEFLNQCGILFRHSCPHTHHQNGLVERKHRQVVELGLTLLAQAKLPLHFWRDSFHASVYHINRLPTSALKMLTPYEKLFKHKADYKMLKCFGCACYPYLRDYNKHKFDFHTSKCIFIGYSPAHKGYKCMHHSGRIYTARHVIFDENAFPFSSYPAFNSENRTQSISSSALSHHQVFHLSNLSVVSNPYNSSFESYSPACSSSIELFSSADHQQANEATQCQTPNLNPALEPVHDLDSPNTTDPTQIPLPSQSQITSNNIQHVQNNHPMTTRGKAGIFKPKMYTAVLVHKEPDLVGEALQDTN